jgi:adenine-specific DNA-methyltransferase
VNFIENQTPEKLRGAFFTEPDIAAFLTRWVLETKPRTVLEPSCGDGAFFQALAESPGGRACHVQGWEIDPATAERARANARALAGLEVTVNLGDFLEWFLFRAQDVCFDAVLGNPPFVRYQYLPERQQFLAEKIFAKCHLPFTKHTNAWVPFVIASVAMLAPGGRLGMVLPAEILHVRHAEPLRTFLAARCARTLILDPEELWFEDTLQGVVLLLAEKKVAPGESRGEVAVHAMPLRKMVQEDPARWWQRAEYVRNGATEGKWMRLLLTAPERRLLEGLRGEDNCPTFAQIAQVDVGIVTGANKFFLVSDDVVERFELQRWARPMFGRSEHAEGLIYSESDHAANKSSGLPANFLWFDDLPLSAFPERTREYLAAGEAEGLNGRFKCRVRRPWYRVPSVYATPVAMLKRCHHFPRLILNELGAFTTDTAYRVKPDPGISPCGLVYSTLNSLTCLCAELEGRHYGGGVLELVPSEIERLLVPLNPASLDDLKAVDRAFRAASEHDALLRAQDERLLTRIGLSRQDALGLHAAWDRLRRRRQRRSA